MTRLTNSQGATLVVTSEEQAAFWEARGYKRADRSAEKPKKATAKKAAAKPESK